MPNQLTFNMQQQQQAEWSWAAVSASVSGFFGAPAGPGGGLAAVRSGERQPWYPGQGLTTVHHLATPAIAGPSPFAYGSADPLEHE